VPEEHRDFDELDTLRGCRRDAFDDAIGRYLPSQVSRRYQLNNDGPKPQNATGTRGNDGTAREIQKTP